MKGNLLLFLFTFSASILFSQTYQERKIMSIIQDNDVEQLENLIQNGLSPNTNITIDNFWDEDVFSLMDIAASYQKPDIIRLLLKHEAEFNEYGDYALDISAKNAYIEILDILMENNAKPNTRTLRYALSSGNIDVVNKIYTRLPSDVEDKEIFDAFKSAGDQASEDKNYSLAATYYIGAGNYDFDKTELCRVRGIAYLNIGYLKESIADFDYFLENSAEYYEEYKYPEDLMMQLEGLIYLYRGYAKMNLNEDKNSACVDFRRSKMLGLNPYEDEAIAKYCEME